MPTSDRRARLIDVRLPGGGGGAILSDAGAAGTASMAPTVLAPQNLALSGGVLLVSAATPQAALTATWNAPGGTPPTGYVIQWSTSALFSAATARAAAGDQVSAVLDGLPCGVTIYARIAAVVRGVVSAWSETASATTPSDTTAPAAPTGLVTSWDSQSGDLTMRCAPPSSANYRDVRFRIYASDGGTLLRTEHRADASYVWSREQHYADTSGAYDLSVHIVADARSWGGVYSATSVTASPTLAPLSAPTISAATNVLSVSLNIGAVAGAADYRIRAYLGGVLTETLYAADRYVLYTPSSSGAWTFDAAARDGLGQVGAASAATASVEASSPEAFIADLRASVTYSDSAGTSPATLAGLKDGDNATNVVTYAASTPWRWTQADRQLIDRVRRVTLSTSAALAGYIGVSQDGTTWAWYAGGTASGGVWAPVAQASEAAAQAAPATLAAGVWRVNLPALAQARYVRLGHRNTATSYALREWYPRAALEADDLTVETLSALSADLGTITAGDISGASLVIGDGRVLLDPTFGIMMEPGATPDKPGYGEEGCSIRWTPGFLTEFAALIYCYATNTGSVESNVLNISAEGKSLDWGTNGVVIIRAERSDLTDTTLTLDGQTKVATFSDDLTVAGAITASGGITVEAWSSALSLSNSWVAYSADFVVQVKRTPDGVVHVRGMIKNGATTAGTLLFTLPAGYRPAVAFNTIVSSNNAAASLLVGSDGTVKIYSGSATWLSVCMAPFIAA